MADNDIEIKFAADTGDLEAAARAAAAAIEGIADSVTSLNESAGQFSALFGAAMKDGAGKNADEAKSKVAALAAEFIAVQKGVQETLAAYQKLGAQSHDKGAGDGTKEITEHYQELSKAVENAYKLHAEELASEVRLHQITYSQETDALKSALEARRLAEQATFDGELAKLREGSAEYEKVLKERNAAYAKYTDDQRKLTQKATEEESREWKSVADQIAGAFNSQLRGLLAGTTSWSEAMKKISADLILKMIEDQLKLSMEFLARKAQELSVHIAAETGMTAATTAGAAARSAAQIATGQTSILEVVANAFKAIGASSGQTAAEVTAETAPEVGPAAPAVGAAAGATTYATAMSYMAATATPYDLGTDYVVRGGLALIHAGETIIPAARGSGPYTGAGVGSQVHAPVSINVSALDSQSVARFFNDNSKHVLRAVNDAVKRGAHLGLRGVRT